MHRFGIQIKTEQLWSKVAAWVCLHIWLLLLSAKSGDNWDNWYQFWHLLLMKLKTFQAESNISHPLHWIGAIKWEGNNTVEKFRLDVFKISIVLLYAFLRFHTSAPNWMKLSGSISGCLNPQKNERIRNFKNSVEALLLSISTALLRSVVTFHTFLLDSLSRPFDDLLLTERWWIANIEIWRDPDLVSGYPCHSYLPEFAKCAWLQSLSRTVVSTLGLLILGLWNLKLILLM